MSNSDPHATVVALLASDGSLITSNEGVDESASFYSVVINVGTENDVARDMRVVIYCYGEELFDPTTNESLGRFEVVRGEGAVIQTQPKMSVVKSSRTRSQLRRKGFGLNALAGGLDPENYESVNVSAPFVHVRVGDLVRFV